MILQELTSLQQEVRKMSQIRKELDELKATLKSIPAGSNTQFPPLPIESRINVANKLQYDQNAVAPEEATQSGKVSFAHLADELHNSGLPMVSRATQPRLQTKTVIKPVIGASAVNKHISAVKTHRNVDIFVTRLHPHTYVGELRSCVDEVKGELHVYDTKCTQLKSRYEHLYASFYIVADFSTVDMSAVGMLSQLTQLQQLPLR